MRPTPEVLSRYSCADYFSSKWSQRGLWDEAAQLMFVLPAQDTFENAGSSFFVVARPGTDGIEFGYRAGQAGIWAFYPISNEFVFMARTIEALVTGWYSGNITV